MQVEGDQMLEWKSMLDSLKDYSNVFFKCTLQALNHNFYIALNSLFCVGWADMCVTVYVGHLQSHVWPRIASHTPLCDAMYS